MGKNTNGIDQDTRNGLMMEDLDTKLDLVLDHVIGITERLTRVEIKVDKIDDRLNNVEGQLIAVIIKLDTKADKKDVEELKRRTDKLEAHVGIV